MFRNLVVLNSDALNRKLFMFTVGALEDAAFKNCIDGIPTLLGHDGLQPIGWSFPFALYMEPKLTRLVGEYQVTETNEDQGLINRVYSVAVSRRYQEECEPYREQLDKIVGSFRSESGRYVGVGCAAYLDEGILDKMYPHLSSLRDSDGLIFLDDLLVRFEYMGQGVFKDRQQDVSIFCHQYFRRSLSRINNFHFEFLDCFMHLQGHSGVKLRIALDKNLIGVASSFHLREELEFAWGPKYSDDIDKIKLGVTKLTCDQRQKLFSGVSEMQFWWKADENQKILEAEELRNDPTDGTKSDRYGCRYIHSIYDLSAETFEHFDGAIRMYNTEDMLGRLEKEMNRAGKNSMYTKLFRVDGDLKLSQWKSLITYYYQGNPLTYEYFGLKEEHERLFEGDSPVQNKTILERTVPYKMDHGDGVRLFLSYHKPTDVMEAYERIVINPDTYSDGDKTYEIMEFDALEIKKAMARIGQHLTIPKNIKFISPKDNCTNFPTILHSSENLEEKLQATIKAYLNLFERLSKRNPTVALTLGWPVADKEVRLSVFGRVTEVISWMKENGGIPIEYEAFRTWVEEQSNWLRKHHEGNFKRDDLFDLIGRDGTIFMHRKTVEHSWIKFKFDASGQLGYELTFPKGAEELFTAVKEGVLQAAVFFVVEKATCSKTQKNYFTSDTSKVFDEDVTAELSESGSIGAFWTDTARLIAMKPH